MTKKIQDFLDSRTFWHVYRYSVVVQNPKYAIGTNLFGIMIGIRHNCQYAVDITNSAREFSEIIDYFVNYLVYLWRFGSFTESRISYRVQNNSVSWLGFGNLLSMLIRIQ